MAGRKSDANLNDSPQNDGLKSTGQSTDELLSSSQLQVAVPATRKPKLRDSTNPSSDNISPSTHESHQTSTASINEATRSRDALEERPDVTLQLRDALVRLEQELTDMGLSDSDRTDVLLKFEPVKVLTAQIPADGSEYHLNLEKLKAELKQSWKIIEVERERDLQQQDTIEHMRQEIQKYQDMAKSSITIHPQAGAYANMTQFQIAQEERLQDANRVSIIILA